MASQIVFGRVGLFQYGNVTPVMLTGYGEVSETITASGSNQQTTITAPAVNPGGGYPFARVATDVAIYVKFGTNPDATSDTGGRFLVPAGAVEYFAVNPGYEAAVVTVA